MLVHLLLFVDDHARRRQSVLQVSWLVYLRVFLHRGLRSLEEPALERLRGLKVDSLSEQCLLVLEHFFTGGFDQTQFMHIQLHFILEYFEGGQDRYGVANANILLGEPHSKLALLVGEARRGFLRGGVLVHPQNTRDDASRVVHYSTVRRDDNLQPKKCFSSFFM